MESDKAGKVWESGICDAETTAARGDSGVTGGLPPPICTFSKRVLTLPGFSFGDLTPSHLVARIPKSLPQPPLELSACIFQLPVA